MQVPETKKTTCRGRTGPHTPGQPEAGAWKDPGWGPSPPLIRGHPSPHPPVPPPLPHSHPRPRASWPPPGLMLPGAGGGGLLGSPRGSWARGRPGGRLSRSSLRPAAMTASRRTARPILALRSCPQALVTTRRAWGSLGRAGARYRRPTRPGGHPGAWSPVGEVEAGWGVSASPSLRAQLPTGPRRGKAGGRLGGRGQVSPPHPPPPPPPDFCKLVRFIFVCTPCSFPFPPNG